MSFKNIEKIRNFSLPVFTALVVTTVFCIPYLRNSFLFIGHDHFFHLSRITGMADALSRGDLLPLIYPYKNNGFGYACPTFYCDLLLIPFALLYLCGTALSTTYKLVIFTATLAAYLSMYHCLKQMFHKSTNAHLGAILYTFANYHLVNVYIRGALGEIFALIFFPMVFLGLYRILVQKKSSCVTLCAGITGLILSHNISFVFGMFLVLVYTCIFSGDLQITQLRIIIRALLWSFLLTAWYTLPLMDQLHQQKLILHFYAEKLVLSNQAMTLRDYFRNTLASPLDFHTNPGWFLPLFSVPVFFLQIRSLKICRFIRTAAILGWICYLLPAKIIPWDSLSSLRFIQFPWRLMILTLPAFCICTCALFTYARGMRNTVFTLGITLLVLINAGFHIHGLCSDAWDFGITSDTTYEDILAGEIIDPYFSATYMRVELAGGEYLPLYTADFRNYPPVIRNADGEKLPVSYTKEGNTLAFHLSEEYKDTSLVLPLTWYKGYQVQTRKNGTWADVPTFRSNDAFVLFTAEDGGDYRCIYKASPVVIISRLCSVTALIYLVYNSMISRSSGTKTLP
ncbi:MAG: hypothetical protein IJJ44_09400 [Solobacterium sp.]|nr:hypothetical protein [Solobacterium sp.]